MLCEQFVVFAVRRSHRGQRIEGDPGRMRCLCEKTRCLRRGLGNYLRTSDRSLLAQNPSNLESPSQSHDTREVSAQSESG